MHVYFKSTAKNMEMLTAEVTGWGWGMGTGKGGKVGENKDRGKQR